MLNDFNREGLGIEVNLSLPAVRVIRSPDRIIERQRRPTAIRVDNVPEYVRGALLQLRGKMVIPTGILGRTYI